MHLLISINNNVSEWRDTLRVASDKPRLPIPFAFGGAFIKRGHKLSAINIASSLPPSDKSIAPFENVYTRKELTLALNKVDLASFWGGLALSSMFRQFSSLSFRKCVILNSYVWALDVPPTARSLKAVTIARITARFAKAVVVMTEEQASAVRASLKGNAPVIKFKCGIDTAFYQAPSSYTDIPDKYRDLVDKLLLKPYVILTGDELRFNRDAIQLVANSGITLVRVSQYSHAEMNLIRRDIQQRGIDDRFIILERIDYRFMRFLLQHAAAYVSLINSKWQPAGWTAMCEALSCGLPVVAYEGLASREMVQLGAKSAYFKSVPMDDVHAFQEVMQSFVNTSDRPAISIKARLFSSEVLDFIRTADDFVQDVEKLC